jgi:hypothetical protein
MEWQTKGQDQNKAGRPVLCNHHNHPWGVHARMTAEILEIPVAVPGTSHFLSVVLA